MFMAFGKRTPRRRLGYVADYCAVCRNVRTFTLKRVGSGWHVNYIPLGPARVVGHELWCETCGATFLAEPRDYAEIARRPMDDPLHLAEVTSPTLMDRSRERFDFDDAILSGTYDPALRPAILREPFDLLDHAIQVRMKTPTLDRGTLLAFAFAILGLAVTIAAMATQAPGRRSGPPTAAIIGLLGVFGGGLTGAVRVSSGYRRYIRDQAIPALARAVAPLHPTLDELKLLRRALKKDKKATRHALDPPKFLRAIERARP